LVLTDYFIHKLPAVLAPSVIRELSAGEIITTGYSRYDQKVCGIPYHSFLIAFAFASGSAVNLIFLIIPDKGSLDDEIVLTMSYTYTIDAVKKALCKRKVMYCIKDISLTYTVIAYKAVILGENSSSFSS